MGEKSYTLGFQKHTYGTDGCYQLCIA